MTTPLDKIEAMFAQYPDIVGELPYRMDIEQDSKLNLRWKALMTKCPDWRCLT